MRPCDLDKSRRIAFHPCPPGQAEKAIRLLEGLEGVNARLGIRPNALMVRYHVCEYTLRGLETALASEGFRLDTGFASRLRRALTHFCESIQRRNVAAMEPDIKSQQAFMKVYERHLHGDRDETPEEWRSYR